MADYGFSALNDSSSVIVSNKYKVMVFSERGQFSITSRYSDREGRVQLFSSGLFVPKSLRRSSLGTSVAVMHRWASTLQCLEDRGTGPAS